MPSSGSICTVGGTDHTITLRRPSTLEYQEDCNFHVLYLGTILIL